MKKLSSILLMLFVALLIGGAAFLATWDIPAPVTRVDEVIPNDRFPR